MLERAVACLDTSTRHVCSASKRSAPGRRRLHSTFWRHGAGDLDLPIWWAASFLSFVRSKRREKTGEIPYNPGGGVSLPDIGMLDFLYPAKTLSYLQRLSSAGKERSRRTQVPCASSGARKFSSSRCARTQAVISEATGLKESTRPSGVNTLLSGNAGSRTKDPFWLPQQSTSGNLLQNELSRFFDWTDRSKWPLDGDPAYFDAVWGIYKKLDEKINTDTALKRLANCLSFSTRKLETERMLAVIARLPTNESWTSTLNLLQTHPLEEVVAQYAKVCSQDNVDFDSSVAILAHAARKENWECVLRIEKEYSLAVRPSPDSQLSALLKPLRLAMGRWADPVAAWSSLLRYLQRSKSIQEPTARSLLASLARKAINHVDDWPSQKETIGAIVRSVYAHDAVSPGLSNRVLQLLGEAVQSQLSSSQHVHEYFGQLLAEVFEEHRKLGYDLRVELRDQVYAALSGLQRRVDVKRKPTKRFRQPNGQSTKVIANTPNIDGSVRSPPHVVEDVEDPVQQEYTEAFLTAVRLGQIGQIEHQFERLISASPGSPSPALWGLVIRAYTSSGRLTDARDVLRRMRETGTQPDLHCYEPVLDTLAALGETKAIVELLEEANPASVPPDPALLTSLVRSHISNKRLEVAEDAVRLIAESEKAHGVSSASTSSWNLLLAAHAAGRDLLSVERVFAEMSDVGVVADAGTLEALMRALCLVHKSSKARRLQRALMASHNIEPDARHYKWLIWGFCGQRQYSMAITVYREMLAAGIKPNADTRAGFFRAAANQHMTYGTPLMFRRIMREFRGAYEDYLRSDPDGKRGNENIEALFQSSAGFARSVATLVTVYTEHRAYNAAFHLLRLYTKRSTRVWTAPRYHLQLLAAVMSLHRRRRDFEAVGNAWKACVHHANKWAGLDGTITYPVYIEEESLTKDNADNDTAETLTVIQRPGRLQAECLALPLSHLLPCLERTEQHQLAYEIITSVLAAGYVLNTAAWNAVVTALASSKEPLHLLQAFQYCEQLLMPNFPGWNSKATLIPYSTLQTKYWGGLQHMKLPALGSGDLASRTRHTLLPRFDTLLELRKAYSRLEEQDRRESSLGEKREVASTTNVNEYQGTVVLTTDALATIAPLTVQAIRTMPDIKIPFRFSRSGARLRNAALQRRKQSLLLAAEKDLHRYPTPEKTLSLVRESELPSVHHRKHATTNGDDDAED